MIIEIYGKKDCKDCEGAKNKFSAFLKKWKLQDKHKIIFYDVETEEGMIEQVNNNVSKIPSIIILDGNKELKWWEGKVPLSKEFKDILKEEDV